MSAKKKAVEPEAFTFTYDGTTITLPSYDPSLTPTADRPSQMQLAKRKAELVSELGYSTGIKSYEYELNQLQVGHIGIVIEAHLMKVADQSAYEAAAVVERMIAEDAVSETIDLWNSWLAESNAEGTDELGESSGSQES